ncbi:MAG: DEAD/DEAH box helicase family protein [Actinomycetota bacterium]|uniref:DEAD/DEAH box helicase n=1 Tax=Euzebya rosea TaxID=2052804 RepID=UPI000D3E6927|nr:DEAD/DEAH box helicase family protein [Euzebya rosea]
MSDHYASCDTPSLLAPGVRWRRPQKGAIAALIAHWSRTDDVPSLVSLPTGTGKTAIAIAAPYLMEAPPTRVLVLVPSAALRGQIAAQFSDQRVLRMVGALHEDSNPDVLAMKGLAEDWDDIRRHDVVVALPNSISPSHYVDREPPPPDLFDLIVVDEAHHAPAQTWRAVLEHFHWKRALLLTATPTRRDRKAVPGDMIYRYPLRQALADGSFNPIVPHLLDAPQPFDPVRTDAAIADKVVDLAGDPNHHASTVMIRGRGIERLRELRKLYADRGLDGELLHSRMGAAKRQTVLDGLASGAVRVVFVDGMLGEGYDLPSLRIVGYHDKHRSFEPTVQMIGRLARTSPEHFSPSSVVTVRDHDVYPHLQGALRALYDHEDADWATVLPQVIDDHVEQEQRNRAFIQGVAAEGSGTVNAAALTPLMRLIAFQIADEGWAPWFVGDGQHAQGLSVGEPFAGGLVVYQGVHQTARLFVLVTEHRDQPRWSTDTEMASRRFELHLLAYRPASGDHPALLLLNSNVGLAQRGLVALLEMPEGSRLVDHQRLNAYLDRLPRHSVSAVGVRTTGLAGQAGTAYRNFLGSGVEQGLRRVDVSGAALGHVNLQYDYGGRSASGGAALEKAKIWVTRYVPLAAYDEWVSSVVEGLRDVAPALVPLLPTVERGRTLTAWPQSSVISAEVDPSLLGQGWILESGVGIPIEDVLLVPRDLQQVADTNDVLPIDAIVADSPEPPIWTGQMHLDGTVTGDDLDVRHGHQTGLFSDLLTNFPPTAYFVDGTTVVGHTLYPPPDVPRPFDPEQLIVHDWSGTRITTETAASLPKRSTEVCVHTAFERWADAQPMLGIHRWLICNDGSGEIADHLLIEEDANGVVRLGLWHSKPSGAASPGLRIADLQVVVSQAARSRWHFRSPGLWESLLRRLDGHESPHATIIHGDELLLRQRLDPSDGSWPQTRPQLVPTIGIVQPGLSKQQLIDAVNSGRGQAFVQLLAVAELAAESVDGDLRILNSA